MRKLILLATVVICVNTTPYNPEGFTFDDDAVEFGFPPKTPAKMAQEKLHRACMARNAAKLLNKYAYDTISGACWDDPNLGKWFH